MVNQDLLQTSLLISNELRPGVSLQGSHSRIVCLNHTLPKGSGVERKLSLPKQRQLQRSGCDSFFCKKVGYASTKITVAACLVGPPLGTAL